jgi:predicted metalloprotease with PDZ domain
MSTLNATAPFDWSALFRKRLDSTAKESPVSGIENGGWKLVYTDKPAHLEGRRGNFGEVYSIGLQVGQDGTVADSMVGSPAFEAGVSSGMKIVGVNGRVFNSELLDAAVNDSRNSEQPITLLVIVDDYYRTATINYHDGPRYPHLLRDGAKPDYLDDLIKARVGQ